MVYFFTQRHRSGHRLGEGQRRKRKSPLGSYTTSQREDESKQVFRVDWTISNFLSREGGSKMDAVSVLLIALSFAIFYGVVKFCEAVAEEQEGKKE